MVVVAFPQMYAISLGLRADDYYYCPRYLKIDSPISKLHFIAESAKYWGGKEATLGDQRNGVEVASSTRILFNSV